MAAATYTSTLSSDVASIWRKLQTKLYTGMKLGVEEWRHLDGFGKMPDVNYTTREILVPLDITVGYGVSNLREGGYEARPSSPAPSELSLTWITRNKRFTVSRKVRQIDQRSRNAMIENQIKYQGRKAVEAIARDVGDYMWGYSTAYLAQVSAGASSATSHTITLKNAYANSAITNAAFIASKFNVGDYVALIQSAALVANAIGKVTAKSATTPSITVTWNAAVTTTTGDYIVKANSLENTTITGTDYNYGLVGFLDMLATASVHGLSSGTIAEWAPALYDTTTGGRFTGVKLNKMKQEVQNDGGGTLNTLYIAQGVERDVISLYQAQARFSSPFGMEIDGSVKSKGIEIRSTPRTPPGVVFGFDKKSIKKLQLLDKPSDQPLWDDADKVQDMAMWVFTIDFPIQLVVLNRGNLAAYTGQTEQ